MRLNSFEDLNKLKEELQKKRDIERKEKTKIIVGMGTCGIAAGAREVAEAIVNEIKKRNLDVELMQTGCIGMCEQEVLVDVVKPGADRITYGAVKPGDVGRIIAEHVVNDRIVEEKAVARMEY
ncbi:MAG: (2Fe-2S) ferredoxin domain-containing protein [Dethiobacteria bacterium]